MSYFRNESLPTHGASPLYAVKVGDWLRISWGGYRLPFGILRYPAVATHVSAGKLTLSFLAWR